MNSKIKYILLLFFVFVFVSLFSFTIEPLSLNDPSNNKFDPRTTFDTNNYDVQYHDNITDKSDNVSKGTWVKDVSGNLVFVPWVDPSQNITYYTSGAYPYGASTYVPNYEDSVYLSKSTGQSTLSNVYPTSASLGICNQGTGIDNKAKIEQSCNVLSTDVCASTTCCVLLGGAKCVSGDSNGPFMKANYSDPFIKNKDYYFYTGRCYGNCP